MASCRSALERERPDILYSVRFAGTPGFPRQAILACPSLSWVSVGGAGIDHLIPWDASRLTVTNAAGVGAETMAQYALASILHFTLGFHGFAASQRERRWSEGKVASVKGLTLAILGLGNTGRAVAPLAATIGMRVIGMRANPTATPTCRSCRWTRRAPDGARQGRYRARLPCRSRKGRAISSTGRNSRR